MLTAAPAYKCPAAPYEAAMLIEADCRKRMIRDRTQIDLFAAEPGPLGVAGPDVSAGVRQLVEERGIAYHPEHQVEAVDEGTISFTNGVIAEYDLLAYVPPHRAPSPVRDAGLLGGDGWVAVDVHTMETPFSGVYAIGDVTGVPLKSGKALPMAGTFAHGQGKVVARNIARQIKGEAGTARFDGNGACFIETGDGRAGFGRGNFYGDPEPEVKLHNVGRRWHFAKVAFEKKWLRQWF